jgi:hypothetical protein
VTAHAADQVGGGQRVLVAPAVAVPHQPATPGRPRSASRGGSDG